VSALTGRPVKIGERLTRHPEEGNAGAAGSVQADQMDTIGPGRSLEPHGVHLAPHPHDEMDAIWLGRPFEPDDVHLVRVGEPAVSRRE
jgi:hypothetical protein